MTQVLQSPRVWAAALLLLWVAALAVTWNALEPLHTDQLFDPSLGMAVYLSAWCATTFWVLGSAQLLWLPPAEWHVRSRWFRLTALTWRLGWVLLVAHTFAAFTVFHDWSHEEAVRHTARVSGVGEGVYVNYLVLVVWWAEAAWMSAVPEHYIRRPKWAGRVIHGFLAFVVFNATVVYGFGLTRWAGVGWFAILLLSIVRRRMGRPA